ncbi:hypothetical protein SLS62_007208 [Diatrype stigma]|uniref:Uncharacterized protein n=1 Tax=Diatrype stigma TaxID=117547 RepID=A0AAN9UX25_9PEZI
MRSSSDGTLQWKDRQSLTTADLREPFYGADLEMELGDSFVASIFGGWVPVPIEDIARRRRQRSGGGPTFGAGIAWRQSLSWDYHRIRPNVARLFREASWSPGNDLTKLIQPQALAGETRAYSQKRGLVLPASQEGEHATAALPDFHRSGEGWRWNRRPGASFRILQYDGYMCPEIDLPFATDDVVREREARPPSPSSVVPAAAATKASPPASRAASDQRRDNRGGVSRTAGGEEMATSSPAHRRSGTPQHKIPEPKVREKEGNSVMMIDLSPKRKGDQAVPKRVFFGRAGVVDVVLRRPSSSTATTTASPSPPSNHCDISVDELKKRLSQLISV